MEIFDGPEQVRAAIGRHVGYSEWVEITQDRIDAFADATGDQQWIHVDPVRAAQGPYGATIAHGYLTLSLLPALSAQVMEIRGFSMMVNYGLGKVRFPAPVPVGSRIRAGVEFSILEERASGWQFTTVQSVEIDGGTRPAVVAETIRLMVA